MTGTLRVGAAVLALALGLGGGVLALASRTAPELPYYDSPELTPRWSETDHHVEPFELTTQTGEPLRSSDLAGRVYVASFIYTRCSVVCPRLVQSLRQVQAATAGTRAQILSFSVTPAQDPPDVLAQFGRDRNIDPAAWKLLTGSQDTIYRLARQSYFADDARLVLAGAEGDFLHTEKLVLVDGDGRLRGVYNGTQPFDVERLIADIRVLAR